MRSWRAIPGLIVVTLFLGACASGSPASTGAAPSAAAPAREPAAAPAAPAAAAPTAAPALVQVKMAAVPGSLSHAGRYVAMARGYFREEGIDFEEAAFDTSAKMLPALAAGQVDMAVGGMSAGLFNAIAQGIPVRIVLDSTSAPPGDSAGGILARKDLVDGGQVREVRDLRGLRAAITSKGQSTEMVLAAALTQAGLSLADLEVNELAYPDMNLALANRNVDVAVTFEPFAAQAVSQGFAARFKDWGDILPNDHMAMVMYSAAFAETQSDAARRYAKAYVRGIRDYVAARNQGRDRDAIVGILMEYSPLKNREIFDQMTWVPLDPDGRVNAAAVAYAQDWFADQGYVRTKVDMAQVVDNQFADYALAQLGPYRP
jgi:NitT/TauT family transport system substrate-binding protein